MRREFNVSLIVIRVTSIKANLISKELNSKTTKLFIKVSLKIIRNMDMELSFFLTGRFMRVISEKESLLIEEN